ncbi:MAG TPA: DUF4478 domain-containing protein, partial [Gammaproteobacteria bacterium]|nr:DUF4478 domain-containing protein [Gammaproteobacteria bacterium]
MSEDKNTARISPYGHLDILSQAEVNLLVKASGADGCYDIFRRCSLAVLNVGSNMDDTKEVLEKYRDFDIHVISRERGVKLEVENAPASAFVDGEMITGIREHLFAVLRDIVYARNEVELSGRFDLQDSSGITNAVFHILRNARIIEPQTEPDLVICWGGHSISRGEYEYTKEVGHEMGLRGLNIGTGCGPGAMKGP